MALTPEVSQLIEKMIAEVKKDVYRRTGMSLNSFIDTFSSILAQLNKDEAKLVGAGFNPKNIPLYKGLFEVLTLTIGERRGTADNQGGRVNFDQQYALAELDRKRLIVVANYIEEMLNDKTLTRQLKEIAKGSGILDTLCDNIALLPIVKNNPELAAQIKPGQFEITESYCDEVRKRAVELLEMKGFVVVQGIPQSATVDRQNRLLTLCMNAISDIKRYANAAFFDDSEYFNANYVRPFRRSSAESDEGDEDEKSKEMVTA